MPSKKRKLPYSVIILNIGRTELLRNLLLLLLLILITYPLFYFFFIAPTIQSAHIKQSEYDATRVALFLSTHLFADTKIYSKYLITNEIKQELQELQYTLNLDRIKIFSPTGEIVYSPDAGEVGIFVGDDYFYDYVAKGQTFSRFAKKEKTASNERKMTPDTIDVYIPIVRENIFVGAFEIPSSIMVNEEIFEKILNRTTIGIYIIGFILLVVTFSVMLEASEISIKQIETERELLLSKKNLEQQIRQRTVDLIKSNQGLTLEIDIRKKTEEELRKEKIKAEQANVAKSHFLENISHELKTPLHHVISFGSLTLQEIERSRSKEKIEMYATRIIQKGTELLDLVERLISLSALELETTEYHFEEIDIQRMIQTTITNLGVQRKAKGIEIIFEHGNIASHLIGDHAKLLQALKSLILNTICYSPKNGTITVILSETTMISNNSDIPALKIAIEDRRAGMPKGELETIFDKFTLEDNTCIESGGPGLNLAICKNIVNAHQGMIRAENNPEEGTTTIAVVLPRNQEGKELLEKE